MMITTISSRSKGEVEEDLFDNWGDEGFGNYDTDFGENEGPEVSFEKYYGQS